MKIAVILELRQALNTCRVILTASEVGKTFLFSSKPVRKNPSLDSWRKDYLFVAKVRITFHLIVQSFSYHREGPKSGLVIGNRVFRVPATTGKLLIVITWDHPSSLIYLKLSTIISNTNLPDKNQCKDPHFYQWIRWDKMLKIWDEKQ